MASGQANELESLRNDLQEALRRGESDRARIGALQGEIDQHRREAQHQVRNILSVVRSIARRTAVEGETAEDYQARLDGRLASFTRLQAHILRNPPRGIDLRTLISDELLTFGLGEGAQARVEGADTCLRPRPASILGLAFHELACMAVDSNDLAGSAIHVEVRWQTETNGISPGILVIEWKQTGRGEHASMEPQFGFGREFLEQAVTYEIGGEVRLFTTDQGLHCSLRLPAEDVIVV